MKRQNAPKFWPIERKAKRFVLEPLPGPHPKSRCIPMGVILRDILGYVENIKEARLVLNNGLIKVDNKLVRSPNFSAGLMDIISIGTENYRILPNDHGLHLHKITAAEAKIKLSRIKNKVYVKKKIQLNLHDGKNILVDKNEHKTGDVLVLDTEKNTVKDVLKFEIDSIALVTGGNNIGDVGKIKKIIITKSPQVNYVVLIIGDKEIPIPKEYIFVLGKDKPVISLGETNE